MYDNVLCNSMPHIIERYKEYAMGIPSKRFLQQDAEVIAYNSF
jgi:hypothetical protein